MGGTPRDQAITSLLNIPDECSEGKEKSKHKGLRGLEKEREEGSRHGRNSEPAERSMAQKSLYFISN
jgi:hypothetical protein